MNVFSIQSMNVCYLTNSTRIRIRLLCVVSVINTNEIIMKMRNFRLQMQKIFLHSFVLGLSPDRFLNSPYLFR